MKTRKTLLAAGIAMIAASLPTLANDVVRVSGWGGDNVVVVNTLINEVLVDELAAAGITVRYEPVEGDFAQILTNALSAGTAPDVFYVDSFWAYPVFQSGKIDPVSDDNMAIADELIPSLNEAFMHNGQLMGIAKDFNTLAVQYDLDVFDDAGVEPPNEDDDWNSFKSKLQQVQSNLDDVYGLCVVPDYARFAAFALATGWKPFNDEGHTLLDDRFREAFEFYVNLVDDGAAVLATDLGQGWTGGCFGNGDTAVAIEGAWMIGFLRDQAPNMYYSTTSIPKHPETGDRGNLVFTVSWSVATDSKVKDSAHTLVGLLTSPKAQQWVLESGLALPSLEALGDNAYFQEDNRESITSRVVFEGASNGQVEPFQFAQYGGDWKAIVDEALSAALLKERTIDDAIAFAQQRYDRLTGRQ
ncbi:MAG: extracellular solute-binding protein [Saccharospirillum sp.]|nr:extracellular solute-binding protein [Saccharospirillum sp.]